MKKIGIIGHLDNQPVRDMAGTILKWADENGSECRVCSKLGEIIGNLDIASPKDEIWLHSDIIISLGGDGSMLSAAQVAGPHEIPVLGINLGRLGFLTDVSVDLVIDSLERLKKGEYSYEERMMLEMNIPTLDNGNFIALNDFVFDHGYDLHLVQLDLHSNEAFVCSYDADGIIVSSPTGSTAYSLSVGGPIFNPLMEAIIVSPVSPHTLSLRPIVFPAGDKISVKAGGQGKKLRISADGQVVCDLEYGQAADIRKSPHKLKLIKFDGGSFYEILRSKLHWGARPLLKS